MNIALIGSPKYENVRKIRDFLFTVKQKLGTDVNIITRGNKDGCEKYVRKYALEFGFRYTEYNPAHTVRNLYSGMTKDYYEKPYHPTQKLHQYDCVVKHADKIIYFGGIKPSEQKHFERLLSSLADIRVHRRYIPGTTWCQAVRNGYSRGASKSTDHF